MAIRRGSHWVYDTRYHLVWAPKYRKWVLQGAIRERVRELFCEIAAHHGFEMEELEVDKDHVHLFLSFPPRYSIRVVVGLLKAVSAKEIREEFPEVRKQLWGGEFWEDGYFVRTVGDKVTADVIRKYIRFHEAKKRGVDQLDLF
jgi:putative transposase